MGRIVSRVAPGSTPLVRLTNSAGLHKCGKAGASAVGHKQPNEAATYLGPTPFNTTACTFATVCSKNAGSASVLPVSACTCTAKSA